MTSAIETSGLTVRFGEFVAVDDLDLAVPAGSVYGFLGPNGAGKSTTIRALLGLLAPASGSVSIAGFDVATEGGEARARCGVLLDDDGLYDRLTAQENLEFAGRIAQMPAADRAQRSRELLEHIGLADRATERVAGWSLGMRKKLAVSRAIFHRPEVVFLDEPTNGLDPTARQALRADIAALAADGDTTVFITTHDLDDAERECDVVGVMRDGRLVAQGAPAELRRAQASARLDLIGAGFDEGTASAIGALADVTSTALTPEGMTVELSGTDASGAPVVAAAVRAGAQIEAVNRSTSSLEDVFVQLTAAEADEGEPT